MILLDTNVLIDLHLLDLPDDEPMAASILSRAELEFGICSAPAVELAAGRTQRLNDLDEIFAWMAFDLDCTRSYGFIAARARATGAKVRSKDALIAAQAHRHGAAVMTANLDDFAPFAHLVQVVPPPGRAS
ncbi:hypothetical protein GCM10025864_26660 [Luteimicrobium album]|uniref:Ribonuclease VapC n=1 Tax=Luteimicrobium album TaxID=1054550 RepID=A0ABQ6I363_9MICO|nr:PIN domain-containing protein [Luteimicrobium album]GMA24907.1 hypothetical protein GCM10025864_26660 [Luteimicrobium album]